MSLFILGMLTMAVIDLLCIVLLRNKYREALRVLDEIL